MGERVTLIRAGRGMGKTDAMLAWMQEAPDGEHRILVSHSGQEAMRVLRLADERGLNLESWQFVALDELTHRSGGLWSGVRLRPGPHSFVLGVDNAEMALDQLLGYHVGAMTVTQ